MKKMNLLAMAVLLMAVIEMQAFTPAEVQALTSDQIAALPLDQIATLTSANIQLLTPTQIAAFTPIQIPAFIAQQIIAFTATQIAALTIAQIAAFTQAQLIALTQVQVQALTQDQISSRFDQIIGRIGWFTENQITGLTSSQVQALTATNLSCLNGTLTLALLNSHIQDLLPAQIGQFKADATQTRLFTADILNKMTQNQIQGFVESQFPVFMTFVLPAHYNQFTQDQFQKFIKPTMIKSLNQVQVQGLSSAQIGALSIDQIVGLAALASNICPITYFTVDQLRTLFASPQFGLLTPDQLTSFVGYLTSSQITGLLSTFMPDQIGSLSTAQIQALSTAQINSLTLTQIGGLTGDQLRALTQNQSDVLRPRVALATDTTNIQRLDINSLIPAQFFFVTSDQIKKFSRDQVPLFTGPQINAIQPEVFGIFVNHKYNGDHHGLYCLGDDGDKADYFTQDQIGQITDPTYIRNEQLESLHYSDFSASQISKMTSDQKTHLIGVPPSSSGYSDGGDSHGHHICAHHASTDGIHLKFRHRAKKSDAWSSFSWKDKDGDPSAYCGVSDGYTTNYYISRGGHYQYALGDGSSGVQTAHDSSYFDNKDDWQVDDDTVSWQGHGLN